MYEVAMTLRIICIDDKARRSLAILNTLNVLNSLIVLKADKLTPYPDYICWYMISKIESSTTLPSSQFILSPTYLEIPRASILVPIS